MQIDAPELAAMITYQLGALAGIARFAGSRMTHMSFHSALGTMAAADAAFDTPLINAVAAFDPALIIISASSRAIEDAADRAHLRVVTTFLADRAYDDHGLLVPRKIPNAVIHDPTLVLGRVRRMLNDGVVITHGGTALTMRPRSILVHGGTAGSVDLARAIRVEIEQGGGRVVPVSRQTP